MKDRKDRAVANRIKKLTDVPGSGKWAGLSLAIANNGGDNQIRIIKCSPTSVGQDIPEFAPFMDRARRFRRAVTTNPAWKGELLA